MKIAFIYHWFAHYRKPIVREIGAQLSPEFSFDFLSDTASLEPAMEVMLAGDFDSLFAAKPNCQFFRVRNRGLAGFIWQSGVIGRILKEPYDIVVSLGELRILSTWIAAVIARLRRKRVYYWSHGLYGNESWLTLKVRLSFYRLADGMFLYGNYSRNLLLEKGFDPDRLHVIYNSLDHRRQVELRESISDASVQLIRQELFPTSTLDPLLIFVGRITRTKKLDQLLAAFAILNEQNSANLLVVGEGPALASLKSYALELDCSDRIRFVGSCHDEDQLAQYLTAADICVSPGNVGLLAMHSLVYGTPVITHGDKSRQMPEFEAIIDRETGGFFSANDISSLVDKLADWVNRVKTDRDRVRRNCQSVIDRVYNPTYQCDVFRKVFMGETSSIEAVDLSCECLLKSNAQETPKK